MKLWNCVGERTNGCFCCVIWIICWFQNSQFADQFSLGSVRCLFHTFFPQHQMISWWLLQSDEFLLMMHIECILLRIFFLRIKTKNKEEFFGRIDFAEFLMKRISLCNTFEKGIACTQFSQLNSAFSCFVDFVAFFHNLTASSLRNM